VFGGFSAKSLNERLVDVGAVALITADEQMRGGKTLPLKSIADEAIAMGGCDAVKSVIVYRRTGGKIDWHAGRDLWMHELADAGPTTARQNGSAPSIRCSSSTPPARPASRRACSTAPAATCCGPRRR
jgi:acyl-coenzyme A synthetase/AMP-(fatty) acid ligase